MDSENEVSEEISHQSKPPPIYISMVENVQPLISLLTETAENDFEIKILKDKEVKIQTKTEEKYKLITKALIEKNTEFHTYKPKKDRPFNVLKF